MKSIVSIIMCLALLASCEDSNLNEVSPGETALLAVGQSIQLNAGSEKKTVTFTSIKENSLCPEEAVCVWLGRFVAEIQIENATNHLGLGDLHDTNYTGEITVDAISVTILDVENHSNDLPTMVKLKFELVD